MTNSTGTVTRRGQQRDKPFRDALRMEAAMANRREPTPAPPGSLRSIARNLLDRADKCTLAAREVADRLDGKPAQSIEMEGDVVQYVVSDRPLTAAEWAAEVEADYTARGEARPVLIAGNGKFS